MGQEISEKNSKFISREKLAEIIKEKLKKEIESARRLLKSGIEPLKVADGFIHDIFKMMEEGFYRRNPNLSIEEINLKIDDNIRFIERLKRNKKRRRNQ